MPLIQKHSENIDSELFSDSEASDWNYPEIFWNQYWNSIDVTLKMIWINPDADWRLDNANRYRANLHQKMQSDNWIMFGVEQSQ